MAKLKPEFWKVAPLKLVSWKLVSLNSARPWKVYYEKSLEIKEKIGDIQGMALTKYGTANILHQRKEFDNALNLYLESEEILEKIGDKYNLMKVYHNLILCYEDMNQKDKAYKYYQKYEELRKQLGIESL